MQEEHIPGYLAGVNGDPLMTAVTVILIVMVLIGGVSYFKLHAVPEHIAHGKNHTQLQLIAVLTMLALFTHNNFFWVIALVLAVVEVPDILAPLKSIANSLETLAGREQAEVQTPITKTTDEVQESITKTTDVEGEA